MMLMATKDSNKTNPWQFWDPFIKLDFFELTYPILKGQIQD